MKDFTDEKRYIRAKKQVECLKSFYNHLITFVIIITALAILNYWTNGWSHPWFLWTVFGWGIGLAFHAVRAFRWNPVFNKEWEERKIRELMEKEQYKK